MMNNTAEKGVIKNFDFKFWGSIIVVIVTLGVSVIGVIMLTKSIGAYDKANDVVTKVAKVGGRL